MKYLVDTNILLSYPEFVLQADIDILLTYKVICELDNKKYEPGTIGLASRTVTRWLDEANKTGSLEAGVETSSGNRVYVIMDDSLDMPTDDALIQVGVQLKSVGTEFVLLSNDVNVRIKGSISGLSTLGWGGEKKETTQGQCLSEILVSDDVIDALYAAGEIPCLPGWDIPLNGYVMLRSDVRSNTTAVCRCEGEKLKVVGGKKKMFGLSHRNVDQMCAIDALSRDLPLVTMVGKAGSGKTLLAVAAALEALLEKRTVEKIVIIRPTVPVGKDVGFLPGGLGEKMAAWAGPLYDNLEVLMNGKGKNLELYLQNGAITVEPTTFMRGRSLNNTFVVLDEAQSLTRHEMKTIATRMGFKSKLVVTGDLDQIDNPRVSSSDNGLSILIEAFRGSEWASCLNLIKGERSDFSSAAADRL